MDRRRTRKRAFTRAGAAIASGAVIGTVLVLVSWPVAGVAMIFAGGGTGLAQLHRPGGVPILVYHSVSPDASWLPWAANTSVRPETLLRHLKALRAGGWTFISTNQFVAYSRSGRPLPKRCIVLHFDDAYLDNYLFAVPILRALKAPATFFASTDFIAPGDTPRAQGGDPAGWRGYMNAAELREIDADPLFDIEAHGTNHGRIPVSDTQADTITAANWRRHAPLSWALRAGDKSAWFEAETPPACIAVGTPVPRNDSALVGRWWRLGKGPEDEAAFTDRVSGMLQSAHDGLAAVLGRAPRTMAWPFDRCCDVSIAAAQQAGFDVVTGGRGENRPEEAPDVLSRVHMQDRAFGGGPLWLEGIAARARANSASGRLVWHVLTALAARLRRRRFGAPGYNSS